MSEPLKPDEFGYSAREANVPTLYRDMVREAKALIEPDDTIIDNPEYIRGMCELLASVWPVRGLYTAERARQVAKDMGIGVDIYEACDERNRNDI